MKIRFLLLVMACLTGIWAAKAKEPTNDFTLYYNTTDGKLHQGDLEGAEYPGSDDTYSGSGEEGSYMTLTLTNFVFETTTSAEKALVIPGGVTLVLKGINTITATNAEKALFVSGALTIQGEDGSLTATASKGQSGIEINSLLTIEGGTVTGQGTSVGVYATNLSVTGGSLKGVASALTGDPTGILVNVTLRLSNGVLEGIGGEFERSQGILTEALIVTGGVLKGQGGYSGVSVQEEPSTTGCTITGGASAEETTELEYLSGRKAYGYSGDPAKYVKMVSNNFTLYYRNGKMYDATDGEEEVTDGFTGTYKASDEGKTLTLKDFKFTTTAAYGLQLPAGMTLILEGENAITTTGGGSALQVEEGDLTIRAEEKGSLMLKTNYVATGIGLDIIDGSLTIESGTVVCEGGQSGLFVGADLTINGGSLKGCAVGVVENIPSRGVIVANSLLITGGELEGIGGISSKSASFGVLVVKNLTMTGGTLKGQGEGDNSYGVYVTGKVLTEGCTVTGGENEDSINELVFFDTHYVYNSIIPARYVQITGPSASTPTDTYYSINLEVAAGIDLYNLSAGNHSVAEGDHLFLQFLPEDRTLGAADVLFLIDGIATAFTTNGEGNYYSYILNPVEGNHTILIALKEYPVILPEVEGVEYNVGAGTHRVGYGEKFTFTLTLAEGIDPADVHVFANGIEIQPDELRSVILSYTIDSVMTPITIVIEGTNDGTTGNAVIAEGNVSIATRNGQLTIDNSGQAVDVAVYGIAGKSVVSLRDLRGSKTIDLPAGVYIVRAGTQTTKIVVH